VRGVRDSFEVLVLVATLSRQARGVAHGSWMAASTVALDGIAFEQNSAFFELALALCWVQLECGCLSHS